MGVLIGALEFEGPIEDFDLLSDEPGIFALLVKEKEELELLDMDESEYVRSYLEKHEERGFWAETLPGSLSIAVHYTGDLTAQERREIKDELLRELDSVTELCA